MDKRIKKISDITLNIDFSNADFGNSKCPWDLADKTSGRKCGSGGGICNYFRGVRFLDSVQCGYSKKNPGEVTELAGATELVGGNMGIIPSPGACPRSEKDGENCMCAVKDTSLCKHFCGVSKSDVLCSYPYENLTVLKKDEIDRDLSI